MAKSSRSSAIKANNQRKAANINGPVEAARLERLSARLMEIANQPKPKPESDVNMDASGEDAEKDKPVADAEATAMEVDSVKPSRARVGGKKRIDKRKMKKAGVMFPKYSDRIAARKRNRAAAATAKETET